MAWGMDDAKDLGPKPATLELELSLAYCGTSGVKERGSNID